MTDAEIIKALECCNTEDENGFANCDDCPYYAKGICLTCPEIFDLINRLQADKEALIAGQETLQKALAEKDKEIERLNDALINKCIYLSDDETTEYCVNGPCPEFKTESQIKAEAIKEFAERLNDKAFHDMNDGEAIVCCCDIDNLVKEMVGDTE